MRDYLKQHILTIIIIVGTVITLSLLLVLMLMDRPNSNTVAPGVYPDVVLSEEVLSDQSRSKLEKTAVTTAIDNVFSYSNYGDTTQFLYGLLESSTENFKPEVRSLISKLENDQTGMYSRLEINSDDYVVNVIDVEGVERATVVLKGVLTTNAVSEKMVSVEQILVYHDPYWLLDSYKIIE